MLTANELEEQLIAQQEAHAVATIAVDAKGITVTNPEEEVNDLDSYKDYEFLGNRMSF